MEKAQLSNNKYNTLKIGYCIFLSLILLSCKKEVDFSFNNNSTGSEPLTKKYSDNNIKEVEIFKLDSLGVVDSTSLRKYFININGNIEKLEDKRAFATTLKLTYDSIFNLPSSLYYFSDYILEYSSVTKTDAINRKIVTYWKDELKSVEDSTIYFFNEQHQLIKISNCIDLFNHYIRKKIGYGVFKVDFDEELSYTNDSLLSEKKIIYKFKPNTEYEKDFPVNSTVKYTYDNYKNITKVEESHIFLNRKYNIQKEIVFKNGLPSYHLINSVDKFIYNYKFYK